MEDGVLPNRVMVGWHPAHDKSFPTPRGDELVVFEDYFYGGFGVPIHLGLNSILHVSIFIHFCEDYLGILPHFDLFRHFFCLKARGDMDLGS